MRVEPRNTRPLRLDTLDDDKLIKLPFMLIGLLIPSVYACFTWSFVPPSTRANKIQCICRMVQWVGEEPESF